MPELVIGVLKRHCLPWTGSWAIGGTYKSVVSLINLSRMISYLSSRFLTRLSTNRRNVTFYATFVIHSWPMWTNFPLRMSILTTANTFALLFKCLKFILWVQSFLVRLIFIEHLIWYILRVHTANISNMKTTGITCVPILTVLSMHFLQCIGVCIGSLYFRIKQLSLCIHCTWGNAFAAIKSIHISDLINAIFEWKYMHGNKFRFYIELDANYT